jgi:hypothetical protein
VNVDLDHPEAFSFLTVTSIVVARCTMRFVGMVARVEKDSDEGGPQQCPQMKDFGLGEEGI